MTESKDLFKIDRQNRLPLYDLIEQNFRELILNGKLKTGDPIPSEWELAGLYSVSRLTVRHALDNLSRQGWLNRRHGVGTFIANPNVAQIAPSKLSFTEQMRAIGRQPSSRLISIKVIKAVAEVASNLNLQPGDPVIEIMRVRLADGEPILLETAYLSEQRFPGLEKKVELCAASLYECLTTQYQTIVTTMDQTLEPVLLTESEAKQLETKARIPAILSKVVSHNRHGEAIEYAWSVTRGDKSKFYFSFRRGENGTSS
jgi:GntR family transcriptional regulator